MDDIPLPGEIEVLANPHHPHHPAHHHSLSSSSTSSPIPHPSSPLQQGFSSQPRPTTPKGKERRAPAPIVSSTTSAKPSTIYKPSSGNGDVDHGKRQHDMQMNFKVKIINRTSSQHKAARYDPQKLQDKIHLNDELNPEEKKLYYEQASTNELKELLKAKGLPAAGKKPALVERLMNPVSSQKISPLTIADNVSFSQSPTGSPKLKGGASNSPRFSPYPTGSQENLTLSPRHISNLSLSSPRSSPQPYSNSDSEGDYRSESDFVITPLSSSLPNLSSLPGYKNAPANPSSLSQATSSDSRPNSMILEGDPQDFQYVGSPTLAADESSPPFSLPPRQIPFSVGSYPQSTPLDHIPSPPVTSSSSATAVPSYLQYAQSLPPGGGAPRYQLPMAEPHSSPLGGQYYLVQEEEQPDPRANAGSPYQFRLPSHTPSPGSTHQYPSPHSGGGEGYVEEQGGPYLLPQQPQQELHFSEQVALYQERSMHAGVGMGELGGGRIHSSRMMVQEGQGFQGGYEYEEYAEGGEQHRMVQGEVDVRLPSHGAGFDRHLPRSYASSTAYAFQTFGDPYDPPRGEPPNVL